MSLETGQERHSTFRLWVYDHIDMVKSCENEAAKLKNIKEGLDLSNLTISEEGVLDLLAHISNQTGVFAPQTIADTLGFPNRDSVRKSKSIQADLKSLLDYLVLNEHLQAPKGKKGSTAKGKVSSTSKVSINDQALIAENEVLKAKIAQLESELESRGKAGRFADVIAKHGVVFLEEH
ncbi:hypothetical protein P3742_04960 [Vibrio parahaemolyticus]|uniref:hypothetical protein n=1 Tax=Vibrio harveyi group TaxID=717610 RepID=UPI00146C688D|nr:MULTISPECIES: hypothetical protein [Vibrio harveyi group]MBS9834206.1 hypothetical protein [Vibrio alginolyticus]MDF5674421.1 hypothetical protein [Vibrio parahaemolyticus]NMV10445.1 hypothetical protein [Vibrio parahaemolyticus]